MTTAFDLHGLVNGSGKQTNFTTMLLKLIFKADDTNKEKLRQGFPNAVDAVEYYQRTGVVMDLPTD